MSSLQFNWIDWNINQNIISFLKLDIAPSISLVDSTSQEMLARSLLEGARNLVYDNGMLHCLEKVTNIWCPWWHNPGDRCCRVLNVFLKYLKGKYDIS